MTGLEALNKIQHDFGQLKGQELVACYETIFNALKRLEAIDNAEPSEALELLGFMGNFIIPTALGNKHLKDFCDKEFAIIKAALLKAEKEHKALEIIKEKDVDLRTLKAGFKVECGLQEYNKHQYKENELTEEEFNLLKEVLE